MEGTPFLLPFSRLALLSFPSLTSPYSFLVPFYLHPHSPPLRLPLSCSIPHTSPLITSPSLSPFHPSITHIYFYNCVCATLSPSVLSSSRPPTPSLFPPTTILLPSVSSPPYDPSSYLPFISHFASVLPFISLSYCLWFPTTIFSIFILPSFLQPLYNFSFPPLFPLSYYHLCFLHPASIYPSFLPFWSFIFPAFFTPRPSFLHVSTQFSCCLRSLCLSDIQ